MAHVITKENYSHRDALVGSVSAYLRRDPAFYIGITSGPTDDGQAAMRSRRTGDNFYDANHLNRMIAIYKSKSQDVCRKIETKLLDEYRHRRRCKNEIAGGGGGTAQTEWKFVYLCLAEE